ncbi:MAG: glycosyltransferase [Caldilineaceae bacterium]
MNILLGSHGFPPNQAGGAEWRTYRTARWLAERGHSVQVLAVDDSNWGNVGERRLTDETIDGVRLRRLSYRLNQSLGEAGEFNNPIVYQTIADLLSENRFDLFHLISGVRMTGSAVQAAHAQQVPAIVTLTDFWFLCPRVTLLRRTGEVCRMPEEPVECALCLLNEQRRYRLPHLATKGGTTAMLKQTWPLIDRLGLTRVKPVQELMVARRNFLAKTLALFHKIIAPSAFLANLFQAHGASREQIALIRQGVNIRPEMQRPRYQPHCPLRFGYVGQLAAHKGVDILIRALRQLPYGTDRVQLVIYGNPAQAWPPFLQQLKEESGGDPRIIWGEPFANTEAHKAYEGLDLLLMPSIWYENSPNVILEAFACGTPVMTSDLGGMAELVKHEVNGYLFEPNSVHSLKKALQAVIERPEQLINWRHQIPPVKSVNDEMAEMEAIYQQVYQRRRG